MCPRDGSHELLNVCKASIGHICHLARALTSSRAMSGNAGHAACDTKSETRYFTVLVFGMPLVMFKKLGIHYSNCRRLAKLTMRIHARKVLQHHGILP